MTTVTASERVVVDSPGWVEYLGNGPKAASWECYVDREGLLVPAIVIYEVSKKLLREQGKTIADRFYSHCVGLGDRVIVLDQRSAWAAAQISLQTHLPMVDAIIYAVARAHQAELVTSDAHFSGLPGVTML